MSFTLIWSPRATDEYCRLRQLDAIGAKACASAVRELADRVCPEAAVPLGGSGYYRLPVGAWRVLYRVDGDVVVVMLVGRVP